MKISIVIPCIDRPDGLKECLPLVLAQTHTDLEVIVVGECEDERVKMVPLDDGGEFNRSIARNTGIREATGEVVWLLDCDTLPPAKWLETHLPGVGVGTYVYAPGSILVTLDNLRNVGGFNELLVHGWGWEDVDLFNRFHATGMRRVEGESVNPQPAECDWAARRESLVLNQRVSDFKGL